jgi:hypothetical protein
MNDFKVDEKFYERQAELHNVVPTLNSEGLIELCNYFTTISNFYGFHQPKFKDLDSFDENELVIMCNELSCEVLNYDLIRAYSGIKTYEISAKFLIKAKLLKQA